MHHRPLHMMTFVDVIVAGDINWPQKHCCEALRIFMLLIVASSSTIHTECLIMFPLEQCSRERAAVLRYTQISCPVFRSAQPVTLS